MLELGALVACFVRWIRGRYVGRGGEEERLRGR